MKRRIGDRRGKPRFEIVGDLWGSVDVSASLTVLNLGAGGRCSNPRAAGAGIGPRRDRGRRRRVARGDAAGAPQHAGRADRASAGI